MFACARTCLLHHLGEREFAGYVHVDAVTVLAWEQLRCNPLPSVDLQLGALYGDTVGLAFAVEVFGCIVGEFEQFVCHELGLYFAGLLVSLLEVRFGREPAGDGLA
ncbi:hypothetical protein FTW19_23940 [Terriglobus albidus]|uniref:Uncharacterized protein n=1 Tax=Terriglobus albidus TaxID=1592106 RepID=A0A5B9EIU8_9BACT|nr:hypothetical protein [Terriglobus albidus]QEE30780.1 hypothetical protein FTW19_23940 [Terriglobus albidus]